MKKNIIRVGVVLAICASFGLSSCIGSFAMSNRVLSWNKSIGNKIVNELVFIGLWILPVYEVCTLADVLVLNSIEFWSGDNPMACGTKRIEGTDGMNYLVKCDGKGYDIICENDGTKTRLDFNSDAARWDISVGNETYELFSIVDENHVSMPTINGDHTIVPLTEEGLLAYRAANTPTLFAAR